MKRIAVVVEGQTEEEFIKQVVAPTLEGKGLSMMPFNLLGRINIDRLGNEMSRHYHHFDHVTSLVDLYGFGGREGRGKAELESAIAEKVEKKVGGRFDKRRVTAYIQRHEFEGLLFSSPDSFFHTLPDVTEEIKDQIQSVRNGFNTPEDINDRQETSPSYRLKGLIPGYDKVLYGSLIAKDAGLDLIRQQCPGFNAWLTEMEKL